MSREYSIESTGEESSDYGYDKLKVEQNHEIRNRAGGESSSCNIRIVNLRCNDLRFYDPKSGYIKRAEARCRLRIGKEEILTSSRQKFADPSWSQPFEFKGIDTKLHRNSNLVLEVWHAPLAEEPTPLGQLDINLSNILALDLKQQDIAGSLYHPAGTLPPPKELPPMAASFTLRLGSSKTQEHMANAGGYISKEHKKNAYREVRRQLEEVRKEDVIAALKATRYDPIGTVKLLVDQLIDQRAKKSREAKKWKASGLKMSTAIGHLKNSFRDTQLRDNGNHNILPYRKQGGTADAYQMLPAPKIDHIHLNGEGFIQKRENMRKALLIGINYSNTKKELNGCSDDVDRMRRLLMDLYGFPNDPNFVTVLTDANPDQRLWPTRKNILLACQWLTYQAEPGDVLYFHFSGHGSQRQDLHGTEIDGYDESIMPMDYKTSGHIVDDELFEVLVRPLKDGVKLFSMMDCCHSGSALDLPFQWNLKNGAWETEHCPKYALGDAILFSGCQDEQTSADVHIPKWGSGGAMTMALCTALAQQPYGRSYIGLMSHVHKCMYNRGLAQVPQLSATQKFHGSRIFDFVTCLPNKELHVGQDMRMSTNLDQTRGRTYIPRHFVEKEAED